MAPIDPDQLSLEDLKRRHGLHEDILLRQRRARGEGPEDGKPKDSDPPAGKGGGRSKGDDDDDKDSSLPTSPGTVLLPSSSSTQQTSTSVTSSTTALASAAATTVPTTITVIATPTSSPAVIPSTASLLSSDTVSELLCNQEQNVNCKQISTSSLIPTTSSLSTQRTLPSATATPSEPRNGLNTDTPSPTNSDTTSSPSGVRSRPPSFPPSPVPETSHTPEPGWHGGNFNSIRKHKGNGLSPTAERLLIAVGAIGTFYLMLLFKFKLTVKYRRRYYYCSRNITHSAGEEDRRLFKVQKPENTQGRKSWPLWVAKGRPIPHGCSPKVPQ